MKAILILLPILVVSIAFGQDKKGDGVKIKEPKNVKSSTAPVTHAEAKAVFERVWKTLGTSLKLKGQNPIVVPSDKNPITKNEVLAAFKQIVTKVEPMFKRSASPVAFRTANFRKDFDQAAYTRLVKDGFVMPVGPIVVGKNGSLTTFEFGDGIGVLLIKIADLTHMPVRKFTPSLMGGKGG